ncbi:hypothetical protein D3C75_1029150 [compost metagenome]
MRKVICKALHIGGAHAVWYCLVAARSACTLARGLRIDVMLADQGLCTSTARACYVRVVVPAVENHHAPNLAPPAATWPGRTFAAGPGRLQPAALP